MEQVYLYNIEQTILYKLLKILRNKSWKLGDCAASPTAFIEYKLFDDIYIRAYMNSNNHFAVYKIVATLEYPKEYVKIKLEEWILQHSV